MDYTLENVRLKIQQFSDKLGSDYFPLPVILNRFETDAFDFIKENIKHFEQTQQITENLRPLVVKTELNCIDDPNEIGQFIAPLPINYYQVLSYDIKYTDNTWCRRADIKSHSSYIANKNNPYKKPTKEYPVISQLENLFQIDCGQQAIPMVMKTVYCKKPTFATVGNTAQRIVNLNDDAIEEIILKTVIGLFQKTGDERFQSSAYIEQSYAQLMK